MGTLHQFTNPLILNWFPGMKQSHTAITTQPEKKVRRKYSDIKGYKESSLEKQILKNKCKDWDNDSLVIFLQYFFFLNPIIIDHSQHTVESLCNQFQHQLSCFSCYHLFHVILRADSRLAPSQWQMSLQSNAVSHWLGATLESALILHSPLWSHRPWCSFIKGNTWG